MKILIAGAGIAGSVLARMLQERDHEVIVADPRPDTGASRCAFAYLRTAWWRGEERAEVRRAVDWYEEHGWLLRSDALVTDVQRGRTFTQRDHVLIDPEGPLVKADLALPFRRHFSGNGEVLATLGDGTEVRADRLVLACGADSLRWGPGRAVYGGIFEAPGRQAPQSSFHLLRVTDRLTNVAASGERITRVGASKGRTPEAARELAERILKRMIAAGVVDGTAPWTYRAGTRWEAVDGSPGGGCHIGPYMWTFTGFARSGYARVPSAAQYLIRRLEEQ